MAIQQRFKPAKQGQLEGACGFYAIANAIHLLEPELKQQEIFYWAFKGFLQEDNPRRLLDGTYRGSIKNTLNQVLKKLHEEYIFTLNGNPYTINFEIPYWLDVKPRTRNDVLERLRAVDYKQGNIALMGYHYNDGNTEYANWTVVGQCKNEYLYTFDSSNEAKKIALDDICIDAKHDQNVSRSYNVVSGNLFQIWRQ